MIYTVRFSSLKTFICKNIPKVRRLGNHVHDYIRLRKSQTISNRDFSWLVYKNYNERLVWDGQIGGYTMEKPLLTA